MEIDSEVINLIVVKKGVDTYVFLYNYSSRLELLRAIGRLASNPELNFTWYDAAMVNEKAREEWRVSGRPRRRFLNSL